MVVELANSPASGEEGGEEEIRVTDEDIETTGDLGFGPRSKMLAKNWRDDDDDRRIRRRSFGSLSPYMLSVSISSSSSSSALACLFACANRPASCCCMKTWTTTPLFHNNPTTKHHSHTIFRLPSENKNPVSTMVRVRIIERKAEEEEHRRNPRRNYGDQSLLIPSLVSHHVRCFFSSAGTDRSRSAERPNSPST